MKNQAKINDIFTRLLASRLPSLNLRRKDGDSGRFIAPLLLLPLASGTSSSPTDASTIDCPAASSRFMIHNLQLLPFSQDLLFTDQHTTASSAVFPATLQAPHVSLSLSLSLFLSSGASLLL